MLPSPALCGLREDPQKSKRRCPQERDREDKPEKKCKLLGYLAGPGAPPPTETSCSRAEVVLRTLGLIGAPIPLVALVKKCFFCKALRTLQPTVFPCIDFLELFAGDQEATKAIAKVETHARAVQNCIY